MCAKCQSTKSVHKKKFKLDRPFPIPVSPFESVLMHFLTCLPEWEGTNAMFVVVDKSSKLTKFAPIPTNAIVVGTTNLFFNMWI
jgi:hypothetical protein